MTYTFLNRIGLVLGAALTLPLMAAEPTPYYFSAGLIDSQGDLRKMTQHPLGYAAELGYRMSSSTLGLDLVGHVGYLVVPQEKLDATPNYTTKAGHFGAGLCYPLGSLPATLEVGIVMHTWDIGNLYSPTGNQGENGWKLGGRLVATFNVAPQWAIQLGYTASEYRRGSNPSYLSTSMAYRF